MDIMIKMKRLPYHAVYIALYNYKTHQKCYQSLINTFGDD